MQDLAKLLGDCRAGEYLLFSPNTTQIWGGGGCSENIS